MKTPAASIQLRRRSLVLDKNINGIIDNTEEMFSNNAAAAPFRDMTSLATWGANGDKGINASAPIYKALNDGGKLQANEVTALSALDVSSLDYANCTFPQSNQVHQISALMPQAQTLSNIYVPKPDSIQMNTNNRQSTLLVTQLHGLNALQINEDGFTTEQNVPAVISVRGNGSTMQELLNNDHVIQRYQRRSRLRPRVRDGRAKRLLNYARNHLNRASNSSAGSLFTAVKRGNFRMKRACSPIKSDASSYEKNSKLILGRKIQ
ncbi:hypothetical protein [Variovorax terrae]|uniref:Uncharacterized protein n=1 Tax=Variovorax terrae TaxID=2923278 RepID=A0A9X1VS51_9BURK|nr:hypothetical protein [Variovorax terrae]MCJ0762039.1 hypothetical protein [Variovorax terrae]